MVAYSASIRSRQLRDGSETFDVRFRDQGKSQSKAFASQQAADNWANILRRLGPTAAFEYLELGTKSPLTVEEYAAKYIDNKAGVEGKTTEHYRMYMRLHIAPTLGYLPLDAVTADAISRWIETRKGEGAAAKTIKNEHGFLSAMFQNAVDDGLLNRNPCARSRLPESESTEMVFLSPNEFTTLLAYIPARHQTVTLFLAGSGARWGEVTALKPGDFDIDNSSVRISRAWKHSTAKGWYIGAPKTKRSKRSIALPDNLMAQIIPLIEEGNEYVFTNSFRQPLRQNRFHADVWAPARRLANGQPAFDKSKADPDLPWNARSKGVWDGRQPASKPLGKWPRVHDLRHSHASWLLADGVGIDAVSRRLGHESVKTTLDIYGHVSLERMAQTGDAIGVILSGAMPELTQR